MVEFKHDQKNNRFVLIEVNPKFWGSSLLPIISGVDFPVLYVEHLLGTKVHPVNFQNKSIQFVIPDLVRGIRHPTRLFEFLTTFLNPEVSKDLSYFGLLPYLHYYVSR